MVQFKMGSTKKYSLISFKKAKKENNQENSPRYEFEPEPGTVEDMVCNHGL